MPRRVAITGLGAIAATGHDVATLWPALLRGDSGIAPIENIPTDRLTVKTAAEIRNFDPSAHFAPNKLAMLDRSTQFALVAAREAMAGITLSPHAGAIMAASIGQETFDNSYRQFYGEHARRLHPLTVPRIMPSAPCSHISMEFALRGPSFATASACASATHAIGIAFQMVRSGMLDACVTGGSDASIWPGFLRAWDALRVLSPDICRPFSADRAGLVIGEGAAILVLEEWQHALARGATIHGEIIGFGMSADAADLTAPTIDGPARAMTEALADAALPPMSVDYVNAHGTGTRMNDRTEVAALRQVFGSHLDEMPVSSTKSMIGHCLNAGGALEAVATVLALQHDFLPPTIGYTTPDPDCAIDCVPNQARPAALHVAMSNSFAFGGLNAVLLFRAPA